MLFFAKVVLYVAAAGAVQAPTPTRPLFAAVPHGHWAYKAYSQLVTARIAGWPDCYYRPANGWRGLTRYEFAVGTLRAQRTLTCWQLSAARPATRLAALNTAVGKLSVEFAPEIRQVQ